MSYFSPATRSAVSGEFDVWGWSAWLTQDLVVCEGCRRVLHVRPYVSGGHGDGVPLLCYRGDDMERVRQLTAVIEREGDGYVATCPELDIVSEGATVEGARLNLVEAVEGFFEVASASEIRRRLKTETYVVSIMPTIPASRARLTTGRRSA